MGFLCFAAKGLLYAPNLGFRCIQALYRLYNKGPSTVSVTIELRVFRQ